MLKIKLSNQAYKLYQKIQVAAHAAELSIKQETRLYNLSKRAFNRYIRRSKTHEKFIDY